MQRGLPRGSFEQNEVDEYHTGRPQEPSWSTLGAKRCPFSGLGDRTPYAPRRRGGPTSGGVPFRIIKSFYRAVFCGIPSGC